MPGALELRQRRALGALAYAADSAELSYARLQNTARSYTLPLEGLTYEAAGWVPENRLSIITDAWSCIDHLHRAHYIVRRFDTAEPHPPEIRAFIGSMKPVKEMRNRIQHLDEDIFSGKNCVDGHPVLGSVSWTDARSENFIVHYSISSGQTIDGGIAAKTHLEADYKARDVCRFRLLAADRTLDIDLAMEALRNFIMEFEITVTRSIIFGLREACSARGISLDEPRPHGIADMTTAMRFWPKEEGVWTLRSGSADGFGLAEVPPGAFDLRQDPPEHCADPISVKQT